MAGALAGLASGFLVWGYTLILPLFIREGYNNRFIDSAILLQAISRSNKPPWLTDNTTVGTVVSVYTAGPRAADTWTFSVAAVEVLQLPYGDIKTLKLARQPQKEYDQAVEIWLAPALAQTHYDRGTVALLVGVFAGGLISDAVGNGVIIVMGALALVGAVALVLWLAQPLPPAWGMGS